MDACRELEIKYNLHPALKKEREFGGNFIKKIDYERGDVKRQISNTVRSLLQMYRFQTLGEYNALLSCYNIDMKHVKGAKFDREYNGIVYSAANDKGEILSNPFKSSLFGKVYGFERLTKIMNNNAEILKTNDMTGRSKAVVSAAMRTATTREDFVKTLQKNGMDVVFRTNNDGRIYGVTFIDHENRVALNGSRLGKEFSANVFHNWFNEGRPPQQQQVSQQQPQAQQHVMGMKNVALQPQNNVHQNTSADPDKNVDTSILEETFGIFDFKSHGEDYDEIAFARRMRKKKRKKSVFSV